MPYSGLKSASNMSSREEATLPATRPKSRKSLGYIPSAQSVDQENMTTDVGSLFAGKRAPTERPGRKSRSKSIGPGGLDALKDSTGNRRKSLATIPNPPPKSILKPTLPPLREIPAHRSARQASPKMITPPSAHKMGALIDFDVGPVYPRLTISGTEMLVNPFQIAGSPAVNETRVTLRTEEEQHAAAREREEKERAELEKEITSRRDARRKSLANRRVSFAPEATLHTWDVVVEYQDSTTSSSATKSTRRASSLTQGSIGRSAPASSDPLEAPSTPPEQIEEETVTASPEHQRDLHQKKRRRSSVIPPMNFNNPDDEGFSSSPFSGDSEGSVEEVVEDNGFNLDSEDDDGTLMSMDGGDTTNVSMSDASTETSNRLDEALRQAARQSGNVDEEEDEEVVASFAPWIKKKSSQELISHLDQENVNPFSPAFSKVVPGDEDGQSEADDMTMEITRAVGGIAPTYSSEPEDEDDMSMDVTRAFGGIVNNNTSKAPASRRKSLPAKRRQSTRRISSGNSSSMDDGIMDLTMAIGGIQSMADSTVQQEDEEMTMEFTSVMGGVLSQLKPTHPSTKASLVEPSSAEHRPSIESSAGDETMELDTDMDMTMIMGGIKPATPKALSPELSITTGMDITTALGGILPPPNSVGNRLQAKRIMEMETDFGSSPFRLDPAPESPLKMPMPAHTTISATGSPIMAGMRGQGPRRSVAARQSSTPKKPENAKGETLIQKPTTPSKQSTPQPQIPTTLGKTPPSRNVVMRTSSPKRLFREEIKSARSTPQPLENSNKLMTPNKLFQRDKTTGAATPSFILTPKPKRNSGVGLDRVGLGSPRVAALLDRRGSIVEQAKVFTPSRLEQTHNAVRFADPRAMEEELDRERAADEDRENARAITEREADQGEDKDATQNLKDMIESLSPKKRPLRGRKSLHVGAAKGILGKRPAELDDDEDDEDTGGVKRLKNPYGSPVKSVKLHAPPSKAETTTGRPIRGKDSDGTLTITLSPSKLSPVKLTVTSPPHNGHFRDAEASTNIRDIAPPAEKSPVENPEIDESSYEDDRIQLQDFLNMTSIRFMELTTTKRRHTIAPKTNSNDSEDADKAFILEDCVAAGAATIPMLDLFQHACRELKSYISEGRKAIREIESDTFEENPPLFREYISATPDMKIIMDNQLKNVKTHARLLSKGIWYDWRMTLLETVKESLFRTGEGMIQDEQILDQQQGLLDAVVPQLVERAEALQREEANLQSMAEEIASCDQEALGEARQRLITVNADIEAKRNTLADLKKSLEGKEAEIESGNVKKQIWLDEIREAEKVREECRGWTSTEISALKGKVDALEREHGWTITGVTGTVTSMTYRKEIELVFDASSFLTKQPSSPSKKAANSRIDLWYIGATRERNPIPATAEKDFFLQCIRDHVRGLCQAETPIKDLLNAVGTSWNKSRTVVDDIRLLNISCPTELLKTSDDSITVRSSLLIAPLQSKVEISFHLTSQTGEQGIDVKVEPSAKVGYGERFNEANMGQFLLKRCGDTVEQRDERSMVPWGGAVAELAEKLLARGRKP